MLIACCMRLNTYLPGTNISISICSTRSTDLSAETNWRGINSSHWETAEAEQLRFRGTKGRRQLRPKRLFHEKSKYSVPLINIVERCLRFDPSERPTPETLLKVVQKYMKAPVAGISDYQPIGDHIAEDMQCNKLRMNLDDEYDIRKRL